jgi:DNA-binding response OmpR family regulator
VADVAAYAVGGVAAPEPAYAAPMVRILVIEDDDAIRKALTRGLAEHGATVTAVATAVEAIKVLPVNRPEAVMLDLGLPDLDGSDVLALIRATSDVPVIIATARDDEREIIRLLDAGADDYLIKPFSASQAMARIRAVLRRTAPSATADRRVIVRDLIVDPVARSVTLEGRELSLNRKEFDLLLALASRPGEVVSKRQLLAEVWQMPWGGADRTVDVHLSWLRRKLGETAAEPRYLHSVRGVGVKLVDPGDR